MLDLCGGVLLGLSLVGDQFLEVDLFSFHLSAVGSGDLWLGSSMRPVENAAFVEEFLHKSK